jgi:hypothetical protein
MTRIVLDILRQASEPMTTRDIAFELPTQRALDREDTRLLRTMTKRVGVALREQREKGIASSSEGSGQYGLWGIG